MKDGIKTVVECLWIAVVVLLLWVNTHNINQLREELQSLQKQIATCNCTQGELDKWEKQ